MKKMALIVMLDDYADWEISYLAPLIHEKGEASTWDTRYVSLTREIVRSMGKLTVLPDLALSEVPKRFNALVLIGGKSWLKPEAEWIIPLIETARDNKLPIAAISEAADFLAWNGFLNNVRHTGNSLEQMRSVEGSVYNNADSFDEQARAVIDGNIITANGASPLHFAGAVARLLDLMPTEDIDKWFDSYQSGKTAYRN